MMHLMRGRKGKSNTPGTILSSAVFLGLGALVRIAKRRANKKTQRFYRSIEKMWNVARESVEELDCFSPIQNAESNMRGQFLKLVWTSLKRYGNQEFKRVYSWLEGSVGPINALLNYAGARLRDLAMTLYPLPPPQAFQIREYPDGSKKILTKDEVEGTSDDGADKTYWRYGYIEKGMDTPIFLSHPTLPGMDFVDMIRAHCVELCRQCFIYHVPMLEAHRYIRLLIHRLRPFLDWVYTDGKAGRRSFNPDAEYELRKIVLEIRSLYRKRSRTRQRISQKRGKGTTSISLEVIRRKVITHLEKTIDLKERDFLLRLLDHLDTALITNRDEVKDHIEKIREKILGELQASSDKVKQDALRKILEYTTIDLLAFDDEKTPFEQIREKIITQVSKTTDSKERALFLEFLDTLNLNAGYVVYRDIEKLIDQIQALSQRQGNEWHRILFSDLHHPVSLRQVVFSGDKLLDSLSPILVVAELPVAKHSGKIDLTIFVRREIEGKILWTPVMVLEVKTKTAFDFNLYGFHLKRKRARTVTPAFYAWKRMIDDEEWESIVASGPDNLALDQLKSYEDELIAEYRHIATQDPNPPTSLWKGVIILDGDQSPLEIYPAYQYLIEDLMTGFVYQLVENKDTLAIAPEPLSSGGSTPKISLFVTPSQGPAELLNELTVPRNLPIEDPFRNREQDDRTLTLYVSVPSPTPSGVTAARLSRNWHLLHHIKECIDTSSTPTEVVWLDLMGDYKTDELLERRFGLETLHRERRISQAMYQDLTNTLWSSRFLDLSHNINEVLTEGNEAFDKLCFNISAFLPEREEGEYIVVLDGWEDFQDMVPGHQQHLVRALEQRLLDTLPQSNINIIWVDGGTHHTRMNTHYQRKCINPLRYDSPRRTHLDEIIYNLPTAPMHFWWMNPQQEDVRIIVQDTPTQATPWEVAIHVPQLIGFTETFRGLARRDGIVAPEDVIRDIIKVQSMHGRGVTLSSIAMSDEQLPTDSLPDLLDHALTLVPSVLRQREQVSSEEPKEETPETESQWQSVSQTVSSSGRSIISDRIGIDVTRPPPRPRGTKRYVDTLSTPKDEGITRPWRYDQTPQQFPEDEDDDFDPTTYTPLGADFEFGEIDSIRDREQELRRLHNAAKYLKDQKYVSKTLRGCCKKIERYCAKQFSLIREDPSLKTSKFFLGALLRIKKIILEDPQQTEVWNSLLPLREKLPDLLNSQNRELLHDRNEESLDLFSLYGNNLFLAVLVALGTNKASLAEHLWSSVGEWTFYQMGMDIKDDEVRTVYSFQAILSNLRSRVKTLSQLNLPEKFIGQEQIGAIIWEGTESPLNAFILIPHDGGFLTSLVENLRYKRLPGTWSKCVTTPQKLVTFAQESPSSPDSYPVILSTVEETQVLWVPWKDEEENKIYWDSFIFEHGKPAGRWNVIPWLKLEQVPLAVPRSIPEIPDSVDEILDRMKRIKHKDLQVNLTVWIDLESYEVHIEGESFKERLKFSRTQELVRFLRTPVWSGTGYRSQRKSLTWNHREDISYDEGLSFLKPLVHRSRFYPDEYQYPKTCRDLLGTTLGPEITMVIKKESDGFRVELEDLPTTSTLNKLETLELTKSHLALLTECEELFDTDSGTRHPMTLDVSDVMDIFFPGIDEHSRLAQTFQVAEEESYHEHVSSQEYEDVDDEEHEEFEGEDEEEGERYQERGDEDTEEDEEGSDKVSKVHEDVIFGYDRLEIRTGRVDVWLESAEGDIADVTIVKNIRAYLEYSGAISPEEVKSEVTDNLAPYDLEDGELEKVLGEVREVLMEEGVRFYEE